MHLWSKVLQVLCLHVRLNTLHEFLHCRARSQSQKEMSASCWDFFLDAFKCWEKIPMLLLSSYLKNEVTKILVWAADAYMQTVYKSLMWARSRLCCVGTKLQ